jgi:hypothetical protein
MQLLIVCNHILSGTIHLRKKGGKGTGEGGGVGVGGFKTD